MIPTKSRNRVDIICEKDKIIKTKHKNIHIIYLCKHVVVITKDLFYN